MSFISSKMIGVITCATLATYLFGSWFFSPECQLFNRRCLVLAPGPRLQTSLLGSWFFSQNLVYFIDDVWYKHHGYAYKLFIWKLILFPECRLFSSTMIGVITCATFATYLFGSWFFFQNVVYFIDDVRCYHWGHTCKPVFLEADSFPIMSFISSTMFGVSTMATLATCLFGSSFPRMSFISSTMIGVSS